MQSNLERANRVLFAGDVTQVAFPLSSFTAVSRFAAVTAVSVSALTTEMTSSRPSIVVLTA